MSYKVIMNQICKLDYSFTRTIWYVHWNSLTDYRGSFLWIIRFHVWMTFTVWGKLTFKVDGQVLDRCTRTLPYCQALISEVKSDFKNSNLGVLCDLKKSEEYAKNGSPPPKKTVPLFWSLTKLLLRSEVMCNIRNQLCFWLVSKMAWQQTLWCMICIYKW